MIQAERSQVRFLIRSFGFPIYSILPAALCPWGRLKPLTEISTRNLPGGKGPSLSGLLENVGASMSHRPLGLHGLLQG
jgi:hypothetical protein